MYVERFGLDGYFVLLGKNIEADIIINNYTHVTYILY